MKQHGARERLEVLATTAAGFTLLEVLMAMVVLSIGILGAAGMLQYAEGRFQQSFRASRALALAEARLESKQTVPWEQLLVDDFDDDGVPDVRMEDTGDGLYRAAIDQDGIHLVWTVEPVSTQSISTSGMAWIEVRARYETPFHQVAEVRLRSLRAKLRYTGGY